MDNIITSGIEQFDNAINGFKKGQLIVIGGRPAMGKTCFVLALMKGFAIDNDIPIAFFSLEESSIMIKRKIIEMIETNDMDLKLSDKSQCLDGYPVYVNDNPRLNIRELKAQIKELKNKFEVKVIFIDFIQLIDDYLEDSVKITSELKRIAVDLEVSIVATSQMPRYPLDDQQTSLNINNDNLLWKTNPTAMNYIDVCAIIHRPGYYKERNHSIELYFIKNDNVESLNKISFKDWDSL